MNSFMKIRNLQKRATAMISLANPKFRDELFEKAKVLNLMSHGRRLGESLRSVYPAGLEEIRKFGDQTVQFRPAKPMDDRRIQEHFYNTWGKKWDFVLKYDFHEAKIKWFGGGKLNASYNCLDRHMDKIKTKCAANSRYSCVYFFCQMWPKPHTCHDRLTFKQKDVRQNP